MRVLGRLGGGLLEVKGSGAAVVVGECGADAEAEGGGRGRRSMATGREEGRRGSLAPALRGEGGTPSPCARRRHGREEEGRGVGVPRGRAGREKSRVREMGRPGRGRAARGVDAGWDE